MLAIIASAGAVVLSITNIIYQCKENNKSNYNQKSILCKFGIHIYVTVYSGLNLRKVQYCKHCGKY